MGLLCCSVASGTCKSDRRRVFDEEHHAFAGLWALWRRIFHGDEDEGNITLTDDRSDLTLALPGSGFAANFPRSRGRLRRDEVQNQRAGHIGLVEALDSYGQRLSCPAVVDAGGRSNGQVKEMSRSPPTSQWYLD
jgi:hypothetical protein